MKEFVYMFTGDQRPLHDYAWVSKKRFLREFDVHLAIGFLKTIQDRISRERGRRSTDFYCAIRHVFAELDGLGKLYMGEEGPENTTKNAVEYGKKYLGQVDRRYRNIYGLLYDLYRHGLMHTGLIKTVRFANKTNRLCFLKWGLRSEYPKHLLVERLPRSSKNSYHLWISVPQFRVDAVKSVDAYIADLRSCSRRSRLFIRFRRGYFGTAVAFREHPAAPVSKKKLQLKSYSTSGMDWVKDQL